MLLSGHQPNYLPYPGLIGKILHSDVFIYVTKVQFEKKSWQNRNRICSKDGEIMLTVPVLTKGRFDQRIADVEINNDEPWREKHWNSIRLNYKKCPHYSLYADFFEELYQREWKYLADLNIEIMDFILKELGVSAKILYDRDYNFKGKKTELLINICREVGAAAYLSNKGSQAYIELESFERAGLEHRYIDYKGIVYPQRVRDFLPNLSVIDMLFNCGPFKTREILENRNHYVFSEKNRRMGEV